MKKMTFDYFVLHKHLHALKHCSGKVVFTLSIADMENDCYNNALYLFEDGHTRLLIENISGDYFFVSEDELVFEGKTSEKDRERAKAGVPFSVYNKLNLNSNEIVEMFRIDKNVIACHCYGLNRYIIHTADDYLIEELYEKSAGDLVLFERMMDEESGYIIADEIPFRSDARPHNNRVRQGLYLLDNEKLTKISRHNEDVEFYSVYKDQYVVYNSVRYDSVRGTDADLYCFDLTEKRIVNIPHDVPYIYTSLAAIDEKHVVAARNDRALHGEYQDEYIDKVDITTGKVVCRLNANAQYCVSPSVISDLAYGSENIKKILPAGTGVFFPATIHDSVHIMYGDFLSGSISDVTGKKGKIIDFFAHSDMIYYVALKDDSPQELYCFDMESGCEKRLTYFNDELSNDYAISTPIGITSKSSDGTEIHGFYIKPADFEEGKKYPTILYIHGGPNYVYGSGLFHEKQLMAAQGYGLLFCNFRGSIGRGGVFADTRGKYYSLAYDDLISFTNQCAAELSWIDKNRLGVCGGSYGGMMTNWIITQTNMFKAAVSDRSICNHVTSFLLSDIGFSWIPDTFDATPWNGFDKLWDSSPLKYAPNVTTPTLFVHGVDDFRCTVDESYQMFAALKFHGVPSRVVAFKEERHGFSRDGAPKKRLRRLKEYVAWFEKYL